jgi:hypothetical protein
MIGFFNMPSQEGVEVFAPVDSPGENSSDDNFKGPFNFHYAYHANQFHDTKAISTIQSYISTARDKTHTGGILPVSEVHDRNASPFL